MDENDRNSSDADTHKEENETQKFPTYNLSIANSNVPGIETSQKIVMVEEEGHSEQQQPLGSYPRIMAEEFNFNKGRQAAKTQFSK